MFRFIRCVVGTVLSLAVVGLLLHWVLGNNFRPLVRVAQQTAAQKISALVDQYELEFEKAKTAVERSKERAAELRQQKHQASAGVKSLEREIKIARDETAAAKAQLATLENTLTQGQPIRFVSGRAATAAELKGFVSDYGNRIQIAQEKIGYLEQLMTRRRARFQMLAELEEQSPLAIQRLQNSVDYLGRKVALYREVRQWADEETTAESDLAGLYEQAQRTLEDAHSKLDGKLAELDTLLDASLDLDLKPSKEPVTTDGIVADIRSILTQRMVVVEK